MESGGAGNRAATTRAVVYCVVPAHLAARLHEPLRRHFAGDPAVEVVVERRARGRRSGADRRAAEHPRGAAERRLIRAPEGRRVADRRAALVPVEPPPLPGRLRRYAEQLVFAERLEPTTQDAEDVDTARLVARIQAGERDAFSLLYLRYFDRVYSYMRVLLRDVHEAEDATQQVFTQVFERIADYERRRGLPFRAWLFIVVRNYALAHLRKQGRIDVTDPGELARQQDETGGEEGEAPRIDAPHWISDSELLLFVERLPLSQRQVLMLRFVVGLKNREIAEVLGRSDEDVRILQHRALRFLRERLVAVGRTPSQHRHRARTRTYRRQATVLRARRFVLKM